MSKLVDSINSKAHWILLPKIKKLKKQIKNLKEDFSVITKEYIDDRVKLDAEIKELKLKLDAKK